MIPTMPGHWSEHMNSPVKAEDNMHFNVLVSPTVQGSQRSQSRLPHPVSTEKRLPAPPSLRAVIEVQSRANTIYQPPREERLQASRPSGSGTDAQSKLVSSHSVFPSSVDEAFFESTLPSAFPTKAYDGKPASTSYLIFEPVIEESLNLESTDWRRYDPPVELLKSPEGISQKLDSILAPSIERIKARHAEDEGRRAAASRTERPLARAGRVSTKPGRRVNHPSIDNEIILTSVKNPRTGVLDTAQLNLTQLNLTHLDTPNLTLPRAPSLPSERSLSPNDSGYISSPGSELFRSPRRLSRRSFGLGALFRRTERITENSEEIDKNPIPRPRSSEAWPLPNSPSSPTPSITAQASKSLTGYDTLSTLF